MSPTEHKDDQPVRFGIVGCGGIAQAHLEALSQIPRARLTAVIELRVEAAIATAERFGCKHFLDYRDPAAIELVDAVIVGTPPSIHYEVAKHFLSHRIAVLSEKPLTLTSADARSLVAMSSTEETLLMMASKFRYVSDVIKAKSLIESGVLGKIILYENSFCSRVAMGDRWNARQDISGGGVIVDNGSHAVDILRYLLGPIDVVEGQVGENGQALDVEDTARIQVRTKRGALGNIDLSWTVNKESDHYISVFGSQGTLQIGWSGSRYRIEGTPDWIQFGDGYQKIDALKGQLLNFIGAMKGEEEPLITPTDALASVMVIEKVYESVGQAKWIAVETLSS